MLRCRFPCGLPGLVFVGRQVKIIISQAPTVRVHCECGLEGLVGDLEAALVWAFHEGIRHGRGTKVEIAVDITLRVENLTRPEENLNGLGIP